MAFGGEGLVSITRIEELLLLEERAVPVKNVEPSSIPMAKEVNETMSLLEAIPEKHKLENLRKSMRKYYQRLRLNKNYILENALELSNVSADWNPSASNKTLIDVTFGVEAGSLCAVIGAVGAGKVFIYY